MIQRTQKKFACKTTPKKGGVPVDVDSYLAALPTDKRVVLQKLRRAVKSAAPGAEECISYRMPAYKYRGMLVFFAAFKDHFSFFPGSKSIIKTLEKDLKDFDVAAGTIRFTIDKPLPSALITKIVKARMKENEGR